MIKKVFPVGTEIHLNAESGPPGCRYWLVPGNGGEPRWILPHEQKFAWPFLQQCRPYKFLSRMIWQGLMAAYRGKSLGRVPGIVPLQIIIPEGRNWDHLGWLLAKPPVPTIYIGTPGPNRKAVLGMVDFEMNKIISIAKVPLGPTAGLAINHEVEILDKLAQEKPGRAPVSLFADSKNGIAAQEFIAGSPTGRRLTEEHVACLVDLAIPGETISLHEVVEILDRKIQSLEHMNPEARTVLERVLSEIDDLSPLPAVWEHGDFAPWNLKNATDGTLAAIDWEAASRKGLPLFDLVFFHSIQSFLFGDKKLFPRSSQALIRQYLERLHIAPVMTGKIVQACMVQDWFRCHATGNLLRSDFLLSQLQNLLQRKK